MQSGSSMGINTRCMHIFVLWGSDLHAQSVLINKDLCIGAQSEVYWECVVGWESQPRFGCSTHTHRERERQSSHFFPLIKILLFFCFQERTAQCFFRGGGRGRQFITWQTACHVSTCCTHLLVWSDIASPLSCRYKYLTSFKHNDRT